jgi:NADP-dependent 3-hydroxy acid dehydrogenase YdfG
MKQNKTKQKQSGHRVVPSPTGHFYAATKFAVTALNEGIRNELREIKSHIRSTVIYYIITRLTLLKMCVQAMLMVVFVLTFIPN